VIGRSSGGATGVGGNTGDYGLKGEPGRDEHLDGRRLRVDDAAKFELTLQRLTTHQHLGAELGVGPAADDQELQQEADNRVGEGVEHDRGASQKLTSPPPPQRPENELTW
jgi:hypothetical protein